MFNGIRSDWKPYGTWNCYDVGLSMLYEFTSNGLVCVLCEVKRPANGGFLRLPRAR